jgi:hypothetical protein
MASRSSTTATSGNGLTPADEEMLSRRLKQLEALTAKAPYFGAKEVESVRIIERKVRNRLEPPTPADLDAEAATMVDLYGRAIAESVQMMERGRDPVDEAVSEAIG